MSKKFACKRGDLEPALLVELTSNRVPLDVSAAIGVKFTMTDNAATPTVITGNGVIEDDGSVEKRGWVSYPWVAGDTDVVGLYQGEIELEWSAGRVQSFPAEGYLTVKITEDLD
mgnify:CR=1 FL=1